MSVISYITAAFIACAAYLAGLVTFSVRRDDRLRDAERSALAATRAAAEARRDLDVERARLFRLAAERSDQIEALERQLLEARAEVGFLRGTTEPPPEAA